MSEFESKVEAWFEPIGERIDLLDKRLKAIEEQVDKYLRPAKITSEFFLNAELDAENAELKDWNKRIADSLKEKDKELEKYKELIEFIDNGFSGAPDSVSHLTYKRWQQIKKEAGL